MCVSVFVRVCVVRMSVWCVYMYVCESMCCENVCVRVYYDKGVMTKEKFIDRNDSIKGSFCF